MIENPTTLTEQLHNLVERIATEMRVLLNTINTKLDASGTAVKSAALETARTIQTDLTSTTAAEFDGTSNITPGVSGILPITNGGTGNSTGLAASATKLATARTIQTNLASTSSSSFNGTANITPGVTGILSVANGGTGNNTGNVASADALSTARTISISGDATGSATFDGSADANITATLASSGVTAGSYGPSANASPAHSGTFSVPYVTVDAKGRVTAASTKTITLPSDNNTDTMVTNTLATTTKAYVTGTTSSSTNTGTQVFDTGVYLGTTAGNLTATSFTGNGANLTNLNASNVSSGTLGTAYGGTGSTAGAVLLTGAQTVAGTKTFSSYVVTDGGSYRVDMSADEPGTSHTLMYVKPYGYSYTPILRAVEPNGEGYGVVSDFGSRGNSIFGAGEGQESLLNDLSTDGSENAYVCADSQVKVVTNANTYDNRGVLNFSSSGDSFYLWHYPRINEVYKGDTPSTSVSAQFRLTDSTGTNTAATTLASIELGKSTGSPGTVYAALRAYTDTSGASDYAALGIYAPNGGGTAYTYAPTPASGDSSSKIATTAWVNNAISSGNAETASALENPVTIQTNLASTTAASFDGTANVTPGVTGVLPVANGGTGSTAGAVLLTGAQTVAGTKTFTSIPVIKGTSPNLYAQHTGVTKGTVPASNAYSRIVWHDSEGTATENRLGIVQSEVLADGGTATGLYAYLNESGSTAQASLRLIVPSTGTANAYATCPTPASGDSSTKIATTAWVNNALSNLDLDSTIEDVVGNTLKGSGANAASFTAASSGSYLMIFYHGSNKDSTDSVSVSVEGTVVRTFSVGGFVLTWDDYSTTYYHICHTIISTTVTKGQTIKVTGCASTPTVLILG